MSALYTQRDGVQAVGRPLLAAVVPTLCGCLVLGVGIGLLLLSESIHILLCITLFVSPFES